MDERAEFFETVARVLLGIFFAVGMTFVIYHSVGADMSWDASLTLIAIGAIGVTVLFCFFAMIVGPLLAAAFGITEVIIQLIRAIRRARA